MKTEKELFDIWKKYIDRPIYRVVPSCDYRKIILHGIDPKKDPYENVKKEIKSLYKIIRDLEKKKKVLIFNWGAKEITGVNAMKITLHDLSKPYVDFSPQKESIEYYSKLKGGAANANINKITKRLIEESPNLSTEEWKVVNKLNNWTEKRACENIAFYVIGSSNIFESALFQLTGMNKNKKRVKQQLFYYESPFGSFEHFKKVIDKNGLKKYFSRLKNNLFYLRVMEKIPAREIKIVR